MKLISKTMKEIQLSKHGRNRGKYVALVDDEDYEYLSQWKWHAVKDRSCFYARAWIKGKLFSMHRLIMNTPVGSVCDHKDFNGLNCQKYNMRNCNHSQNGMNKKPRGKSKYLGVYFFIDRKYSNIYKYIRSQIKVDGIIYYLGTSKTEEQAAKRYDMAAKYYHGKFANLNFK